MARPNSLQSKIEARITDSRDYVFLTREFTDLSGRCRCYARYGDRGRRPVGRLGCGVYGLVTANGPSDRPTLHHPEGFAGAARTALTKLGIDLGADRWREGFPADSAGGRGSHQAPLPPQVEFWSDRAGGRALSSREHRLRPDARSAAAEL